MRTEVLKFERDGQVATIATNGQRHVSQVGAVAVEHASLTRAIAYLAKQGYNIVTDCFEVV